MAPRAPTRRPSTLGLTRTQVILCLAVAAVWLGFDFAIPFFALYVRELGVESEAEAVLWSGLLISLSPAIASLTNPFWGMLADRFGAKPMMLRALAAFSLLVALTGLATALWHVVLLRIGIGLVGGFGPLAIAMIVASGPRARHAQALGVLQAAQFLPLALGPAVGGVIADRLSVRVNFFVGGGLIFAALALLAFLPGAPSTPRASPEARARAPSLVQLLATPTFAFPFALLFIAYFVERSFLPTLPLYVGLLGAPAEAVASSTGLVLACGAIAAAASGPLLGRLAGRYALRHLIAAALASGVVLCLLIAFAGNVGQLLALRVALGLLAGGLPTLAYTLGTRAAPPGLLGRQAGLLTSGAMLANASGPAASGVVGSWSLRAVFVVDALLLGTALLALAMGRRWFAKHDGRGPRQDSASLAS